MITYADHMSTNPDAHIPEGRKLDHCMEHDEHTGFERCVAGMDGDGNECGAYEIFADDVCPLSDIYVDGWDEWRDYETDPATGQRRLYSPAYIEAAS